MHTVPASLLNTYSVVIHPPDHIIHAVAELKQRLENEIGWYHSVNALAHITFNVFRAKASALPAWEDYLTDFSMHQEPISLSFDRVQGFSNGSFVLLANEQTDSRLKEVMSTFNNNRPKGAVKKSQRPHLTIGRKLNTAQMKIATDLITEVNIRFIFDQLVLRQLNIAKGQYDIIRTFPLHGGHIEQKY